VHLGKEALALPEDSSEDPLSVLNHFRKSFDLPTVSSLPDKEHFNIIRLQKGESAKQFLTGM
jgi:hypothetical protein